MSDKKRTVIVSQSTLTIMEVANKIIRRVTCHRAKGFLFATLDFYDNEDKDQQTVQVTGKVSLDTLTCLVEMNVVLEFRKSGDTWKLDQDSAPSVYANNHEVTFCATSGLPYYSRSHQKAHVKLINEWNLGR